MIRSSNRVRLVSSHIFRHACKSIYEGYGTVNLNNRVVPSNTSIRGLASLSNPKWYQIKIKRRMKGVGRSLMQTFEKGLKIGARILANRSPQRKRNVACSNGSVTTIPMVVIFIVEVPFPKNSQITFGNIKM
ncbi:hypothetical protein A2U01_0004337 [Trifolium medium]|uniref:Uncharacterized protein n=1 Tax=Trifolium medium TaxID=97028 RepID=A0A392M8N8_9FABA|nr:hypothetical protein [Trifolium medium]